MWATDVNAEALAQLAVESPGLRTRILDVTSNEQVEAVVAACGPVDVLFNCAGYVHQGTILVCTDADWNFAFDLNVTSMYRSCRAVLPGMLAAGKGRSSTCRLSRRA